MGLTYFEAKVQFVETKANYGRGNKKCNSNEETVHCNPNVSEKI